MVVGRIRIVVVVGNSTLSIREGNVDVISLIEGVDATWDSLLVICKDLT